MMTTGRTLGLTLIASAFLACGTGDSPDSTANDASADLPVELTVYSGRNESLIGPLLARYEESTGARLNVRYGGTAELTATLMEEGAFSPADVFISQDAAALGALSARGLLQKLPAEVFDQVDAAHRSAGDDWVGLSGRARSVVYNIELISEEDLPQGLSEVTDPRYRGRFGVAPANGSFQAHMAAYGVLNGTDALTELLEGIAANEPMRYPKNSAIVEAVLAGEVEFGLTNHYYLHRALAETPVAPGRNFFMPVGDGSAFVNLAGAAATSDAAASAELVAFLLGEEAQDYFRQQTFEFPVALASISEGDGGLTADQVDFSSVSDALEETLALIQESGLLE
jgi:iron(III) transport system substrate-binding protein